jgi:hypothetical protein
MGFTPQQWLQDRVLCYVIRTLYVLPLTYFQFREIYSIRICSIWSYTLLLFTDIKLLLQICALCLNPSLSSLIFIRISRFFMAQQLLIGHGLLIVETSRSHPDTSNSLGLLWTSDQPDAPHNTWHWQRDRHPGPDVIRTSNPGRQGAADPLHIRRGHLHQRLQYTWGQIKQWMTWYCVRSFILLTLKCKQE